MNRLGIRYWLIPLACDNEADGCVVAITLLTSENM
jgi:hypothetical protein